MYCINPWDTYVFQTILGFFSYFKTFMHALSQIRIHVLQLYALLTIEFIKGRLYPT